MIKVITFGCWDLLHVGHVRFLEKARAYGTALIVCVASDEVIKEDKGREPVIPLAHRVEMLVSLKFVDMVQPYYSLWFLDQLAFYKPNVLAIGDNWGKDSRHVHAENYMDRLGGRIIKIPRTPDVSTTDIKEKASAYERLGL